LEKLKGRHHLKDQGVDGKITVEWVLGKQGGNVWTGFICLIIGSSGGYR
jgi:hypothetical protein